MTLLAIGWEPELRGILIVIIAVSVLMGGLYLILGTNLGARLGFLVTFASLAGWMALMGFVWMIYGIGLKGPEGSWEPVPGRTVIQDVNSLYTTGVLDEPAVVPEGTSFDDQAPLVADALERDGWEGLDSSSPEFGQAGSAAATFLEETDAFAAGEFVVTNVFDTGGDRYPKINDSLDFVAFFHEPRYVVVEVAPVQITRAEEGRAAPPNIIDSSRQRQYVYMVRDLGARRQPATVLAIGASIIFLTLCWLMHRRDATVVRNRTAPDATPVPVSTGTAVTAD